MKYISELVIKDVISKNVFINPVEFNILTFNLEPKFFNCSSFNEFVIDKVMANSNILVSNRNKEDLKKHIEVNNILDPGIYILVNSFSAFNQYSKYQHVILNNITYDTTANQKLIYDIACEVFSSLLTKNKKIVFSSDPKVGILYNDDLSRHETTTSINKARMKFMNHPLIT